MLFGELKSYLKSSQMQALKGYDMYSEGNKVIVDRVYKYEELEQSLSDILKRLNQENELRMPEFKAKVVPRNKMEYWK